MFHDKDDLTNSPLKVWHKGLAILDFFGFSNEALRGQGILGI